jgi:hypothetical protein
VPGCVTLKPATASWLQSLLEAGQVVSIETGVPFGETADFPRHQKRLKSWSRIDVQPVVNLWEHASGPVPRVRDQARRIRYIDYVWPQPTKVRDFSRVVPVREVLDKVVAWAGDTPVAVRMQVGRGTLIFLGWPLVLRSFRLIAKLELGCVWYSESAGFLAWRAEPFRYRRRDPLSKDLLGYHQSGGTKLACQVKARVTLDRMQECIPGKMPTHACAIY